jgi:hypothetical protein
MLSHQTRRVLCYALRYAAPRQTGAIDDVISEIKSEISKCSPCDVESFLHEAIQQAQDRATNSEILEDFIKYLQARLI